MTQPIVCGHPTPSGPCTRKVLPGAGGCGYHPAPPAPESERHPRAAPTCSCESPAALPARDGEPTRCLWCSRPLPGQRPTIERNGSDQLITTSPTFNDLIRRQLGVLPAEEEVEEANHEEHETRTFNDEIRRARP